MISDNHSRKAHSNTFSKNKNAWASKVTYRTEMNSDWMIFPP